MKTMRGGMNNIWLIASRDLHAAIRSSASYVIIATVLLLDGLLFNALAMGTGSKLSQHVLEDFFFYTSGTTIIASLFLSMRLITEERQQGTLVLLNTSSVKDWEIIVGKYFYAIIFLGCMTALTIYMPLLIFVHGKIAMGHMLAGYLGLMLLGSACIAMGLLGSALAKTQLLAAMLSAAMLVTFILLWQLSYISNPPFDALFKTLALHNEHFEPFQRGLIRTEDLYYYVAVTAIFLFASTRVLEAKRWR
jgi:ABC-2 type transport system permease protein